MALLVATAALTACAGGDNGVVAVPDTSPGDTATVETESTSTDATEPSTSVTDPGGVPTAPAPTTSAPTTTTGPAPSTTAPATTTPPTTAAPTTVPPTTVPRPPGKLLALDVLGFIRVENEHRGGYDRDLFGYPADLDGDGCNTRAEVLQQEALGLVQVDQPGCVVREGDWVSLYDGLTVTDAADLEIDHVVALKEAWDSGAWRWTSSTLVAYGNDLADRRTLRAVTTATNRSKSDKDPSNWVPTNGLCEYLGDWVAIKARWSMTMDQSEYGRIRNLLRGECKGTAIAPFVPVASTR